MLREPSRVEPHGICCSCICNSWNHSLWLVVWFNTRRSEPYVIQYARATLLGFGLVVLMFKLRSIINKFTSIVGVTLLLALWIDIVGFIIIPSSPFFQSFIVLFHYHAISNLYCNFFHLLTLVMYLVDCGRLRCVGAEASMDLVVELSRRRVSARQYVYCSMCSITSYAQIWRETIT